MTGPIWTIAEWRERSTTYVTDGRFIWQPGIGVKRSVTSSGAGLGAMLGVLPAGSVLQVLPSAMGAPAEGSDVTLGDALGEGWDVRSASSWRVIARQAELGPYSRAVLPAAAPNGAAGPWGGARDAEAAAAGLARFLHRVGMPFADTVGRTTELLILSTHPRERGGTQLERNLALPEVCSEVMEGPWSSWRRDLTPAEEAIADGGGYVHSFDANAQYLGPWQTVEVGLGEPREVADERFGIGSPRGAISWWEQYGAAPSIWQLDAPTPTHRLEREPFPLLPPIWSGAGQRYVTGVTMRRVIDVYGHAPRVVRGWVWDQHSRYLRGAGERLRDARAALLEEAPRNPGSVLALEAVKAMYRVFVGRLNSSYVHEAGSAWRRPDWGHIIRASARTNLHRRLAKLEGAAPFAVVVDGLVFVDAEPDPVRFAERVGLPLGTGLGMFSVTGSWSVGKVVNALSAPTGRKVMSVLMEAGRR